jgi:hypothetical protein
MCCLASHSCFIHSGGCQKSGDYCICCVQVPPSTPGTKSVPAHHEEEAEPEEAVIKPAPRFAKFDRNNFKCSRCLKVRCSKRLPHLAWSMTSRCKTPCLQACLMLHSLPMFLTRVLTTLARLYNPVGWL